MKFKKRRNFMKQKTVRTIVVILGLLTAAWMSPAFYDVTAIAQSSGDVVFDETMIDSDDFNPCRMKPGVWTQNPQDGTIVEDGTHVTFNVPSTTAGHTIDDTGGFVNSTVNIMQLVPDEDFEVEVKFDSIPIGAYAQQGVFIQQDENDMLRIEFLSNTAGLGNVYLHVSKFVEGVRVDPMANVEAFVSPSSPIYLKVNRSADTWTISYSDDGTTWAVSQTFSFAMTVSAIGLYGGNTPPNETDPAPAFAAVADYFFNNAARIDPINSAVIEVNASVVGNGTAVVDPETGPYSCGATVQITADPDEGWSFTGWSGIWEGADLSSSDLVISGEVYESVDVTATFTEDIIEYLIYLPIITK
jgi:regulation of enolase protein 1 (concanavalin A-like superfamily)